MAVSPTSERNSRANRLLEDLRDLLLRLPARDAERERGGGQAMDEQKTRVPMHLLRESGRQKTHAQLVRKSGSFCYRYCGALMNKGARK